METNDHFTDELGSCVGEKEEESTMEMETDTAAHENCVTVKIEVYTDTAENWPVDGWERSEADDPVVKTEVKIEFDVAEDLSQSGDVTAEQYLHGDKNQTRVRRSGRKRVGPQGAASGTGSGAASGTGSGGGSGAASGTGSGAQGATSTGIPNSTCRKPKTVKRPCVYCGDFDTNLRRHLKRKHSDTQLVQAALALPRGKEQDSAFAAIRKEGIMEKNQEVLKEGKFMCERNQGVEKRVMCGGCHGFFSKKGIGKHKRKCGKTANLRADTIDFEKIPSGTTVTAEFQETILNHFRDDTVGVLCCNDPTILLLGKKLMGASVSKNKHGVMSSMRLAAKLLVEVREIGDCETLTGEDLVKVEHFDSLEKAIQRLSRDEKTGKQKAGLKVSIGYLLKKLVVVLKVHYIQAKRMTTYHELDVFKALLEHLFRPAEVECESRRNQLRKPQEMPLEQDVKTFRDYVVLRLRVC